ncbi:MAG: hypothetical protein GX591_07290 [Planctomycetes bacterium]|nr:hypothetical protein [Planctomycetota bacterium]
MSGYQIGIATADITPPLGARLAGYGTPRAADGVGHRLRAEAMVCRGEGGSWAVVTSDLVGYPRDLVESIRRRVAQRTDLPAGAVMISATHTHSGPSGVRTYSGQADLAQVDLDYRPWLEDRLVELVAAAAQAVQPGRFEVAWTDARQLASNRRVASTDGVWSNEWRDPDGRHPGYVDPSVMLVGVRRQDGSLAALLVNYGCHPVTLGPRSIKISADYPGYLKDFLEAHHPHLTTMFALAGAGNINPRTCIQVGSRHPRAMGEALGEAVLAAMGKLHPLAGGPVAVSSRPWELVSKRQWRDTPGREQGKAITTEVQALRAGDLAMVAVPGELFSEYVAMFREASPLPETAVISIANDSVGYLPVDEAHGQGGHEVTHAATEAKIEQVLQQHVRDALQGLMG